MNAYLFGAVCPNFNKAAAIVSPFANIEATNEHLKEISAQVQESKHAVVIMDQAGWHIRTPMTMDSCSLRKFPSTWAKRLAFGRDPRAIQLSGCITR